MDIGKNCKICNRIDFLPFYCKKCNANFCKYHYVSPEHNDICDIYVNKFPEPRKIIPIKK